MSSTRILWTASACLSGTFLCAQDVATTPGKWVVGVSVSPGIAYRSLLSTEGDDWNNYIASRNDYEEPRFAYGGSLMCALDLSKRFSVEGGLGYSLMGYQLNIEALTFGDMIDPNRGFIYQTNTISLRAIRYSFHYLELPLRLVLHCGKGRLRSITGVGMTTGYLLRSTSTLVTVNADGSADRDTNESGYDYNVIGLFPTFSTGASYALNDRMDLRLEPQARYGVLQIIDAPVTAHLWSVGVGFSAMWRL